MSKESGHLEMIQGLQEGEELGIDFRCGTGKGNFIKQLRHSIFVETEEGRRNLDSSCCGLPTDGPWTTT